MIYWVHLNVLPVKSYKYQLTLHAEKLIIKNSFPFARFIGFILMYGQG